MDKNTANQTSKQTIAALAIAAALTACSGAPRLAAQDATALAASLDAYVKAAAPKQREERVAVAAAIRELYWTGDEPRAELPENLPPLTVLHRVRHDELSAVVDDIKSWPGEVPAATRADTEETPIERRWRNEFMVQQLKVQLDILESKREMARYKDLFTVDQLEFSNASFIPPQPGVPLGEDQAVFMVTLTNRAPFNVYGADFHVIVTDPRMKFPIVDQVIKYNAGKSPIQVGDSRQIKLSCCDSYNDPTNNQYLRNLALDADIQMDLVAVRDYSKGDRLKDAKFSPEENLQLAATAECLRDITSRLESWTPKAASPACLKI